MAWQNPKTDWKAGDVPAAPDFNRIEGNVQELQNTKETPAGAQAKAEAAAGAVQAALDAHLSDYATPHIYQDISTNPDFAGVKYKLVIEEGKAYLEVVEA